MVSFAMTRKLVDLLALNAPVLLEAREPEIEPGPELRLGAYDGQRPVYTLEGYLALANPGADQYIVEVQDNRCNDRYHFPRSFARIIDARGCMRQVMDQMADGAFCHHWHCARYLSESHGMKFLYDGGGASADNHWYPLSVHDRLDWMEHSWWVPRETGWLFKLDGRWREAPYTLHYLDEYGYVRRSWPLAQALDRPAEQSLGRERVASVTGGPLNLREAALRYLRDYSERPGEEPLLTSWDERGDSCWFTGRDNPFLCRVSCERDQVARVRGRTGPCYVIDVLARLRAARLVPEEWHEARRRRA